MPEEVFTDAIRWENFLFEAGQDLDLGWHLGQLTEAEAKRLYQFVAELYGDDQFRGLLRRLEDRFGIKRT